MSIFTDILPLGGARDENNCLIDAGYSWCEDNQSCIRHWETPCADNYNDCNDCLQRQQKENIACPEDCSKEEPIYYSNDCPLVTCMMYCENG